MRDSELRELVRRYILDSHNADMIVYGRRFLEHYDRGRWMLEYMMDLGRMRNARILDVGCGFGWHALMIAAAGRSTVIANDIRSSMTSVIDARLEALHPQFPPGASVQTLLGDICTVPLESKSFDAIFCNQTVEHIHDVDRFFAVAHRVLKPGGRMVISNDNNLLNRRQLAVTKKMWRRRDRDWSYVRALKEERPIENAEIEPYAVMRERVIRKANPKLSDNEVIRVANATAGMRDQAIAILARAHRPGAKLPKPPRFAWCRNPTTGEYCERQLNPYQVASAINAHGFRSRVRHAFRSFPLSAFNGARFYPLNKLLFQRRSVFVIVSEHA